MRPHRSTVIGMVTAGLLAFALLGPVAFAMLSLRSTPEAPGVSAGGWIVVGFLLMLAVAAAAGLGGALAVLVRRAWRRLRDR